LIIDHTESWSDTRIDVRLPVANTAGTIYVVRRIPLFALASNVVAYVVQAAGLPSQPYGYEIPVQDAAPWPLFRRDERNTVSYRVGGAQRTFHADSTSRDRAALLQAHDNSDG
jgi:hypothetical protein